MPSGTSVISVVAIVYACQSPVFGTVTRPISGPSGASQRTDTVPPEGDATRMPRPSTL
ncbi:Uncharacterised protein [Mycobacteroides abscessus]|nr:Uncharacterised protein [Mycobacteroides abscessus]